MTDLITPLGPGSAPTIMFPMELTGRQAYCIISHAPEVWSAERARNSLMSSPQPSSTYLPHFEYRGSGSIWAEAYCLTCDQGNTAHYNLELLLSLIHI